MFYAGRCGIRQKHSHNIQMLVSEATDDLTRHTSKDEGTIDEPFASSKKCAKKPLKTKGKKIYLYMS